MENIKDDDNKFSWPSIGHDFVNKIKNTMKCFNCGSILGIKSHWNLAKCTECGKTNKIKNLVYFNDKVHGFNDLLKKYKNENELSDDQVNGDNFIKVREERDQTQFDSYQDYLKQARSNGYYSFHNNYYQPKPYLDNKKQFLGPYFPYLPPPDYQWHQQMEEYINRMAKINKITRLLRKDYNAKSSILDEYTKPRVYAIKTLLDTVEDINLRRELTYRDMLRGDFEIRSFTYKDLYTKGQLTDFKTLRGDYLSEKYNFNTKNVTKEDCKNFTNKDLDKINPLSQSMKEERLRRPNFANDYTDYKIDNKLVPSNNYITPSFGDVYENKRYNNDKTLNMKYGYDIRNPTSLYDKSKYKYEQQSMLMPEFFSKTNENRYSHLKKEPVFNEIKNELNEEFIKKEKDLEFLTEKNNSSVHENKLPQLNQIKSLRENHSYLTTKIPIIKRNNYNQIEHW